MKKDWYKFKILGGRYDGYKLRVEAPWHPSAACDIGWLVPRSCKWSNPPMEVAQVVCLYLNADYNALPLESFVGRMLPKE